MLHNQKSQTHLDPPSGTFSAIDLTLSDSSIFIDYNWRVYKDLCCNDHYPIKIENSIIKNSETQTNPPVMNFKNPNWQSNKKLCLTTLFPEANTNQEEPIIHFTNTLITIANKTIPKTNKPWFTEVCKNMIKVCQATLRKVTTNPSSENLNKYKQQRAKT